ncbi:roadblock/LC7 domain-containing protein [Bradymonadaceae bacterium TMQ3]|uniref:Roadblock/LC7 domain-containing protein n=1 Tax=Lujinxingia sediminis TaxID=2480984 RepID=A0ABY0CUS1_9DELT|nr:roadblock/LC7 domain-containing protein [Lujinxingia sediminis]RDV37245.1 roadblock/LC7 domain-containing protein [Bradymonadaceae bacterium TMQ3]RVU46807.1 roadblock/LC7 domain-containing protein [Lujinxingia sediminis]TXC74817.1 roadblock/LC7 domain-containing protein [Bradymonadales bacterium TMQ1]
MLSSQMVIYEEEHQKLTEICERLVRDALAKAIFIVDKDGQLVTATGETTGIDTTGLASLVAGSTAATGSLALMLGEEEFPVHFHEGKNKHLHVSVIGDTLILVVIFDERSSLGLVRLRVKRAYAEMADIIAAVAEKAKDGNKDMDIFGEITDDDIDSLFNDAF